MTDCDRAYIPHKPAPVPPINGPGPYAVGITVSSVKSAPYGGLHVLGRDDENTRGHEDRHFDVIAAVPGGLDTARTAGPAVDSTTSQRYMPRRTNKV